VPAAAGDTARPDHCEQSLAEIGRARAQVQRVETLLAALETGQSRLPLKERCREALALAHETGSDTARPCEDLETALAALAHVIRATFLGPEI
jgi:hypothetical protein